MYSINIILTESDLIQFSSIHALGTQSLVTATDVDQFHEIKSRYNLIMVNTEVKIKGEN